MQRYFYLFSAMILFLSGCARPASPPVPSPVAPTKIVVCDFQQILFPLADEMRDALGQRVAELLRTEIVGLGDYRLIDHDDVQHTLQQQEIPSESKISPQTALGLGQTLGADLVMTGSVVKTGSVYTLNSRVIDVKARTVKTLQSLRGQDVEQLPNLIRQLAQFATGRTAAALGEESSAMAVSDLTPVAILDWRVSEDLQGLEATVTELLGAELVGLGEYTLIDKDVIQLQDIFTQTVQPYNIPDAVMMLDIGKAVKASLVVTGSVTQVGKTYTLHAKFVDVAQKKSKTVQNLWGESVDQIPNLVRQLALIIADKTIIKEEKIQR